MTSRSQEILENVLGCAEYCKSIPRLEHDEAAKLFFSKVAPKKSSFNDEDSEIVERCLKECQFPGNGYTSTQYHPLILRALGTYFHDVFLELIQCDDIGPVLELGGLDNLSVLARYKCANVKRILSSYNNSCNDQMFCYKGKPGQGCMSELCYVKLQCLSALEDIPFLRHCSNLEILRILNCNRAIYPTTSIDSESRAAIDLE